MTPDLFDRIREDVAQEIKSLAGEIAALRSRADQAKSIVEKLGLPVDPSLQWVLGIAPDGDRPAEVVEPVEEAKPTRGAPENLRESNRAIGRERNARVLAALAARPLTWGELIEATDYSKSRLSGALTALRRSGAVRKHEDSGLYLLPHQRLPRDDVPPQMQPSKPGTYTTKTGTVRRMPKQPGIEAVPEHLRHLPAGKAGGPLPQRIEAAEFQLQVLNDVLAHPTTISVETASRLNMSGDQRADRARVSKHMVALAEAGLIRPTGKNRVPIGKKMGKPAIEYAPPEGRVPPTPARPSAVDPGDTAVARGSSVEQEVTLLHKVRDWAVGQQDKGSFTAVDCATALGIPVAAAAAKLEILYDGSKIVKTVKGGGGLVDEYEYHKPVSMGAAALHDRIAAKARSAGNGVKAAVEVPGSGWDPKQFTPNADMQKLIRRVHDAGWPISKGAGHIAVKPPSGPIITLPTTPGKKGFRDAARRLVRAGLK
jgi:DNA-binding transcriptional ArsR family regulator